MTGPERSLLCRLGLHTRERSQHGRVGYCLRGCGHVRQFRRDRLALPLDGGRVVYTFDPDMPGGLGSDHAQGTVLA
jgi:hypothetical protein